MTLETPERVRSPFCLWVWGVGYTPYRQVYDDVVARCTEGQPA